MKWLITFLMNILFLVLFTPLCCFIVFLTMPAASLQELVFWKWNASHPEASLDGIHYWFGADDGCSSCLWLPEPLRAFLLQDNNKQQKSKEESKDWLNTMAVHARHTLQNAYQDSSILFHFPRLLWDVIWYIFYPSEGLRMHSLRTVHKFSRAAVLTDMTLAHKEKRTPFPCRGHQLQTVSKIQMVLGTLDLYFPFYILRQQGQPHASWPSTSRLKRSFFHQSSFCRCCEKVTAEFVDSPWETSLARFC